MPRCHLSKKSAYGIIKMDDVQDEVQDEVDEVQDDVQDNLLDNLEKDLDSIIYNICLNYLEEYINLLKNLHEPSAHEIDVIINEILEVCPTIVIEDEIKSFKDAPLVEIIENLEIIRNNLVSLQN